MNEWMNNHDLSESDTVTETVVGELYRNWVSKMVLSVSEEMMQRTDAVSQQNLVLVLGCQVTYQIIELNEVN